MIGIYMTGVSKILTITFKEGKRVRETEMYIG